MDVTDIVTLIENHPVISGSIMASVFLAGAWKLCVHFFRRRPKPPLSKRATQNSVGDNGSGKGNAVHKGSIDLVDYGMDGMGE